jgi:sugar fermentation stimulation protein A
MRAIGSPGSEPCASLLLLPPLTGGRILRRYKRFLADVELTDGTLITAHVPNTGSMSGCWEPGAPVQLSYSANPRRKLAWTLERADMGGGWIGVNTIRPNAVVAEGIASSAIPALGGYAELRREAGYSAGSHRGRFDIALRGGASPAAFVEVKNVTLLDGDRLRFPDAVSVRGRKHLDLLLAAVGEGYRGVMLFAVNRPEGRVFSPAWGIDPDYGNRLVAVAEAGVEVLAVRIRHTPDGMLVGGALPLDFEKA